MIKQIYSFDFKNEIKNGTAVVNFYSDISNSSKLISSAFNEVKDEIDMEAKFLKVNIDQSRDLAIKYKIPSIQSIIIFKNGKEIKMLNGFLSKNQLKQGIEFNM